MGKTINWYHFTEKTKAQSKIIRYSYSHNRSLSLFISFHFLLSSSEKSHSFWFPCLEVVSRFSSNTLLKIKLRCEVSGPDRLQKTQCFSSALQNAHEKKLRYYTWGRDTAVGRDWIHLHIIGQETSLHIRNLEQIIWLLNSLTSGVVILWVSYHDSFHVKVKCKSNTSKCLL